MVIQNHHIYSPAEINAAPSAEESNLESNIAAVESEVQSLEPNPIAIDNKEESLGSSMDQTGDKGAVVHHEEAAPLIVTAVHLTPAPQAHDNASNSAAVHVTGRCF